MSQTLASLSWLIPASIMVICLGWAIWVAATEEVQRGGFMGDFHILGPLAFIVCWIPILLAWLIWALVK